MRYSVTVQQCFLSDVEKQERGAHESQPPEPAKLFFEAGLALAIPLFLALTAELWLAVAIPGTRASPLHLYAIYMDARFAPPRIYSSPARSSAEVFKGRSLPCLMPFSSPRVWDFLSSRLSTPPPATGFRSVP